MELMVIENNPEDASFYDRIGIDRIFVDLEIIGKLERQGHLNTVVSKHSLEDVLKIKAVLRNSKLLVRVNPINQDSKYEIDQAILNGADCLMLPMFKTKKEVEEFVSFVEGRAKVNLLLETPQAVVRIDEILRVKGIDEIHIGLNDLHIAFGLNLMMEMYQGGILENLASKIKDAGVSLGIGGIAPVNSGLIKGGIIAAEAIRMGCERFILSRAFPKSDRVLFERNLIELKEYFEEVKSWSTTKFLQNREALLRDIVEKRDKG